MARARWFSLFSQSSTSMTRRRSRGAALAPEKLETRALLSSVTFNSTTRQLRVVLSGNEGATITADPTTRVVQVNGVSATIDSSTNLPASFVRQISVIGGSGSNRIDLSGVTSLVGFFNLTRSVISSGAGNDRILGSEVDDIISGGDGVDWIFAGLGNDQINGGNGDDALYGQDGDDFIFGVGGDDLILGGAGTDSLFGDLGDDIIRGGDGSDELWGGFGNDQLFGENDDDRLRGDDGDDLLDAGAGNDSLAGGDGADVLRGGAGNDYMSGGINNDLLFGDAGSDTLDGDEDQDVLNGGDDDDRVNGGHGNDLLLGGAGLDVLRGDSGHDQIRGDAGDDQLFGDDGNDLLLGGSGDDQLVGGFGNDHLDGEIGNDHLDGNHGADRLLGGSGHDVLVAGPGIDLLDGGIQNDLYVFDADTQIDRSVIVDAGGTDALDFLPTTSRSISIDLALSVDQVLNSNVGLRLQSGTTIEGVFGTQLNDTIRGNAVGNILIGHDGDDVLEGLAGRDILIGGNGRDSVDGGADDDVMIGSFSVHDSSLQNLTTLLAAWNSGQSYSNRIESLKNGVGAPRVALRARVDVRNDARDVDTLIGDSGIDYFFRSSLDSAPDLATDELAELLV